MAHAISKQTIEASVVPGEQGLIEITIRLKRDVLDNWWQLMVISDQDDALEPGAVNFIVILNQPRTE